MIKEQYPVAEPEAEKPNQNDDIQFNLFDDHTHDEGYVEAILAEAEQEEAKTSEVKNKKIPEAKEDQSY